jgi:cullin 1
MENLSNQNAQLVGAGLYEKLKKYLDEHLTKLCDGALNLQDEALLKYYTTEWSRYYASSKYLHNLFKYLNRHWVRREMDENRQGVYYIETVNKISY